MSYLYMSYLYFVFVGLDIPYVTVMITSWFPWVLTVEECIATVASDGRLPCCAVQVVT